MLLFTDFDGDPSMSGANGPIKLKLKMFHQQEEQQQQLAAAAAAAEEAAQAAARQGSKKKRKGPTLMGGGASGEEESMTKVHQDDEYVYPSLDLSDDEVAPSDPADLAQDDGIWSPKVSGFLQGGRKQSNIRETKKIIGLFSVVQKVWPPLRPPWVD